MFKDGFRTRSYCLNECAQVGSGAGGRVRRLQMAADLIVTLPPAPTQSYMGYTARPSAPEAASARALTERAPRLQVCSLSINGPPAVAEPAK